MQFVRVFGTWTFLVLTVIFLICLIAMMNYCDVRDSNQGNPIILPIMVKTAILADAFQCDLFGRLGHGGHKRTLSRIHGLKRTGETVHEFFTNTCTATNAVRRKSKRIWEGIRGFVVSFEDVFCRDYTCPAFGRDLARDCGTSMYCQKEKHTDRQTSMTKKSKLNPSRNFMHRRSLYQRQR